MTDASRRSPSGRSRSACACCPRAAAPPLVFFHGPWGLTWDPFLDELAQQLHGATRPSTPAPRRARPDDIYQLDGLWDLVLCYDELLRGARAARARPWWATRSAGWSRARWRRPYPARARRLVLIDPLGFWRDDRPGRQLDGAATRPRLRARVFRDPDGAAARRMFGAAEDPEAAVAARMRLMWAMGATGKFIWPHPRQGAEEAHPPGDRADAARLGQGGSPGAAGLRRRVLARASPARACRPSATPATRRIWSSRRRWPAWWVIS